LSNQRAKGHHAAPAEPRMRFAWIAKEEIDRGWTARVAAELRPGAKIVYA